MPTLLGAPKCQYFNTLTQQFLSGGFLYSFAAGTDNFIATYQTIADAQNMISPNANPVILNVRGECNLVLSGSTKLVLTDGDVSVTTVMGSNTIQGNLIWTVDNLTSSNADIVDANNNYLIKFTGVVGAINYISVTNAATGNGPIITSNGNDVDVDLHIDTRGNGHLKLDSPTDIAGNCTVSGTQTVGTSSVTGNETVGGTLSVTGITTIPTTSGSFNLLPAGLLGWFAMAAAPAGWLTCDGSAISRVTYVNLFTAIGTSFGVGDGSTTFNLPNQARNSLVGLGGAGTGTLANTVGSVGGTETNTITTTNLPVAVPYALGGSVGSSGATSGATFTAPSSSGNWGGGSATAVNNLPPSLVCNLCIRI